MKREDWLEAPKKLVVRIFSLTWDGALHGPSGTQKALGTLTQLGQQLHIVFGPHAVPAADALALDRVDQGVCLGGGWRLAAFANECQRLSNPGDMHDKCGRNDGLAYR